MCMLTYGKYRIYHEATLLSLKYIFVKYWNLLKNMDILLNLYYSDNNASELEALVYYQ